MTIRSWELKGLQKQQFAIRNNSFSLRTEIKIVCVRSHAPCERLDSFVTGAFKRGGL